ncbi:hypothetical protein Vadar_016852 [Vaccinium darrowii]|uniref:Uncharacterized protein n=1 Tax=Vaccinium darrowii TaxID=229202 RepID=A0ACB7Y0G1_9ERIC|nr:hypothetical protein Vadar_016852 [Vaccinium darrowii]
MSSCGTHGSGLSDPKDAQSKFAYAWVGNSVSQCPGQCAWPFHLPIYGPQTLPLGAPTGDVGVDGMVINLATVLAGTVTDPFDSGYFQGPAAAPLESVTTCPGIFGSGAYLGYTGSILTDKATGASYNAQGINGRKLWTLKEEEFLLICMLDEIGDGVKWRAENGFKVGLLQVLHKFCAKPKGINRKAFTMYESWQILFEKNRATSELAENPEGIEVEDIDGEDIRIDTNEYYTTRFANVLIILSTLPDPSFATTRKLTALYQQQPLVLNYHNGPLLKGTVTVNLIWYGNFSLIQRSIIANFIQSMNSGNVPPPPSIASWWQTTENYKGGSSNLVLGTQILDENCSFGKSRTTSQIVDLASKAPMKGSINVVLTAADVLVDGFCMSNCGTHGSGTVTDPFDSGYFQGPAAAPLEAVTACPGIFGSGAYPGYTGSVLTDKATGASYMGCFR